MQGVSYTALTHSEITKHKNCLIFNAIKVDICLLGHFKFRAVEFELYFFIINLMIPPLTSFSLHAGKSLKKKSKLSRI